MADELILVVDDEPNIAEALVYALRKNGYQAEVATNGKEALDKVKAKKPALILMDIMMPVMDGITATKALRQDEHIRDLPVVMVTARGKESDIVKSLDCGADDYVIKPFAVKDILKKIADTLEKAKKGTLPSQFYFQKISQQESISSPIEETNEKIG